MRRKGVKVKVEGIDLILFCLVLTIFRLVTVCSGEISKCKRKFGAKARTQIETQKRERLGMR